jgi:hypothetical protein
MWGAIGQDVRLPSGEHVCDHISALMALTAEGDTQTATVKLFAHEHSQAVDELVWAAWEPHISPPLGHPLATGTLAMDLHEDIACDVRVGSDLLDSYT